MGHALTIPCRIFLIRFKENAGDIMRSGSPEQTMRKIATEVKIIETLKKRRHR